MCIIILALLLIPERKSPPIYAFRYKKRDFDNITINAFMDACVHELHTCIRNTIGMQMSN